MTRKFAAAVLFFLVAAAAPALASDVQVRVVRHSQDIAVSDRDKLAKQMLAVLQSCSVESTAYAVSAGTWPKWIASDSFIHVSFAKPRRVRLMNRHTRTREERGVEEILLPLPEGKWPEHIYVRSGKDRLSYTKFDFRTLKSAVSEEGFRLPE